MVRRTFYLRWYVVSMAIINTASNMQLLPSISLSLLSIVGVRAVASSYTSIANPRPQLSVSKNIINEFVYEVSRPCLHHTSGKWSKALLIVDGQIELPCFI